MRVSWLDSVSATALLALSIAATLPATAVADPATAAIESAIPVPEPAGVPPPTVDDLDPPSAAAPAAPQEREATAPTEETDAEPAKTATVDPTSTPEPAAPPATAPQAETPAPDQAEAKAPSEPKKPPATDEDIARGVPVPEPAGVAPPTIADLGEVPLSPADQAVADELRTLVTDKVDRFIEGKKERTAIQSFYEARGYAPVWSEYGKPTERMRAAIKRLKDAEADGLDPSEYATPDLAPLTGDAQAFAQAELTLMNALLTFAKHAQSGRVTPSRISVNIDVNPPVPEPSEVVEKLAKAKDVAATLDSFNPPHEGFKRLRARLADLRDPPETKAPLIVPDGPLLRPGMTDERVPLLRKRLKVESDPSDETYDPALVEAVKEFQKSKRLAVDGLVGGRTLQALNAGRTTPVDQREAVLSNMERWRWLPRDLGRAYVMVNIPDFTLKMVRDGKAVFHTKIVVGKPRTPSPVFSDEIETIQLNPTWHVPQSIIYGEYLPALERDPDALRRMGLILSRNADGSISVRQPPGEKNALGRIKFNFPNKFQVYLHDTPQKHLFGHERRAYSAGCMRVQDPEQFGEQLLSLGLPGEGYTAQRLTRMYGGNEQWIKLKRFVRVHLVYMNAYVDDAGKLVIRPDVYGYDGRVQSALKGKYQVVNERSQTVSPTRVRRDYRPRLAVEQPRRERPQHNGFFLFPFFR